MIGTTEFSVTARLGIDGEPSVKVTGHCGYGDRTASETVEITDKKALKEIGAVLKKAIVDVREGLGQRATAAACRSLVVATDRGEAITEVKK